jgi:glycosyltransferase involved in cell wall biosynthesis
LKLFEYMASQRPIIASDLPSLREVLGETNATLVPADDPAALAKAMRSLDPAAAATKARVQRAYELVRTNTWQDRAKRIMAFLEARWQRTDQ